MTGYTFTGATHKLYNYALLPWGQLRGIPMQAGNFVIAKWANGGPAPVLIDEAHRLHAFFEANPHLWDVTRAQHGADRFYIRAEPDQAARLLEREDLILSYHPPMDDVQEDVGR